MQLNISIFIFYKCCKVYLYLCMYWIHQMSNKLSVRCGGNLCNFWTMHWLYMCIIFFWLATSRTYVNYLNVKIFSCSVALILPRYLLCSHIQRSPLAPSGGRHGNLICLQLEKYIMCSYQIMYPVRYTGWHLLSVSTPSLQKLIVKLKKYVYMSCVR